MNHRIACIYPMDETTGFLLPIFERLQKESNFIDYRFDTNDINSVALIPQQFYFLKV